MNGPKAPRTGDQQLIRTGELQQGLDRMTVEDIHGDPSVCLPTSPYRSGHTRSEVLNDRARHFRDGLEPRTRRRVGGILKGVVDVHGVQGTPAHRCLTRGPYQGVFSRGRPVHRRHDTRYRHSHLLLNTQTRKLHLGRAGRNNEDRYVAVWSKVRVTLPSRTAATGPLPRLSAGSRCATEPGMHWAAGRDVGQALTTGAEPAHRQRFKSLPRDRLGATLTHAIAALLESPLCVLDLA